MDDSIEISIQDIAEIESAQRALAESHAELVAALEWALPFALNLGQRGLHEDFDHWIDKRQGAQDSLACAKALGGLSGVRP